MTEQEFRDLWAKIAGAIGDEEGKFSLAAAARMAKDQAHAVYQQIFNVGHSERNKKATTDEAALREQVTALTTERDALKVKLDEAGKDQPDASKRVTELEGQIRTLQTTHADEVKALKASVGEARVEGRVESLRAKLVAGGMDADYAEVLTLKPDVRKRIKLNDDGTFEVLQANGGIPFAPADGKDGLDLLSGELIEATRTSKPTLITSGVESGSGQGSNGGRSTDSRGKGAGFYDGIRKGVADAEKAAAPSGGSAAQRMGIRHVGETQ